MLGFNNLNKNMADINKYMLDLKKRVRILERDFEQNTCHHRFTEISKNLLPLPYSTLDSDHYHKICAICGKKETISLSEYKNLLKVLNNEDN